MANEYQFGELEEGCCFNKYLNMGTWLWNSVRSKYRMNFEEHDRESLACFEQAIGRNMDLNASGNQEPGGSEKHRREDLRCLRDT